MLLTCAKIPEQLCSYSCCCCCCCCCCCSVELTLEEWKWLRRATTASRLLWSKVFVVIEKQKSIIERTLKIFSSQTIQRVSKQTNFWRAYFLREIRKLFLEVTSPQHNRRVLANTAKAEEDQFLLTQSSLQSHAENMNWSKNWHSTSPEEQVGLIIGELFGKLNELVTEKTISASISFFVFILHIL